MSKTTSVRDRGRLPGGEHLFEPWEAREIRDRYRTGETGMDLARSYLVSRRTITNVLKGNGYPLDPSEASVILRSAAEECHRIASRNREAVRTLHARGKTAAEVADESGLSVLTVQDIGREIGLRWPRKSIPVAHGTLAGYRRCGPPRCDACKAANAEKMRQYLAKRRRVA